MKKSLLLLAMPLLFLTSLTAQSNFNYNTAFQANSFQQKHTESTYWPATNANSPLVITEEGKGMRTAGIVLTAAGGATLTGAIVLLSTISAHQLECSSGTNVGRLAGGVLLIPVAVGLLIPGTILLVKGSKKMKNGAAVSLGTNGTAASLRYTF